MTAGVATKYYYASSQRIAMRKNGTLHYMFSDHLGSTSVTTDSAGNVVSELRYKPWGETRYAGGTTPTQYQYTSQYSYESDFGLYFYNARWYDSALGRFAQADSIVPGGVQGLDRYAYVNNNPVRYTDPTGHEICMDDGNCKKTITPEMVLIRFGVKLTNGTAGWNQRDKLAALTAVVDTAIRMSADSGKTAVEAFRTAFKTYDKALELRKMEYYEYEGVHAKVVSTGSKISRFCSKSGDFGLRILTWFACTRTRIAKQGRRKEHIMAA